MVKCRYRWGQENLPHWHLCIGRGASCPQSAPRPFEVHAFGAASRPRMCAFHKGLGAVWVNLCHCLCTDTGGEILLPPVVAAVSPSISC